MPIIVQKYGGTSVADVERIRAVADRVVRAREEGNDVVVVVSAMGDMTDELLAMAHQTADAPEPRELDMLLTAGERIAMSLLGIAINARGCRATSFHARRRRLLAPPRHHDHRVSPLVAQLQTWADRNTTRRAARQRTRPRGRDRLDHQRPLRFARLAPRHPPHLLGRRAAALDHRGHNGLVPDHALHARERAIGAVVRGLVATPETELATVGGHHLVGNQAQQREPGSCIFDIEVGWGSEPAVELPAHAFGERGRRERTVVAPAPGEPFAVLGLGLDDHPRAREPAIGEPEQQAVGETLRRERHRVHALNRADRAPPAPRDRAAG